MILVIDNYDSFTYNLVQILEVETEKVQVVRNDEIDIPEIRRRNPSSILISPGPGRPEGAGVCLEVIRELGDSLPILGICLGHQAIGHAFGARIVRAPSLMHGKVSPIHHSGGGIYEGIINPFNATRYHSLVIDRPTLAPEFDITSETEDGIIMGIKHKTHPLEGIQFHPESILTAAGPQLIRNWLAAYRAKEGRGV